MHQSKNKTDRENIGLGTPCEKDLSEGLDEMKLIQQVDVEVHLDVSTMNSEEENVQENNNDIEVRSSSVFNKYNIVEFNDGYFIENIRNNERQFLCGLSGRRSISIKLMKSNNGQKEFSIISSFNRESKPSINDRIIGYLYREGKITRFTTWNREAIVDVKI